VSLKLPNPTRSAKDSIMLDSLVENKAALKATAISENEKVKLTPSVSRNILDEGFWKKIQFLAKLLESIARGLKVLEGDSSNLALVVRVFMDIKSEWSKTLENSNVSSTVRNAVLQRLKYRTNFGIKPIHLAAYILHPRFRG